MVNGRNDENVSRNNVCENEKKTETLNWNLPSCQTSFSLKKKIQQILNFN